jgi:DNA polymerase-3 subunit gamma/tau
MIIERFFKVIAESKALLALGSDGEFVLSLALFKMIESLQIKDIDTMIRGLENELKGVEVSEIMVTSPSPDVSAPAEVITITQDEIDSSLPTPMTKKETIASTIPEPIEKETPIQEPNSIQKPEPTEVEKPAPTKEVEIVSKPVITEEIRVEAIKEKPTPTPVVSQVNPHQKTFDSLVKKIYDRNYDLGSCFKSNITFESFEDNKLTWGSHAEGDNKKMLITHWGLINMFVKDTFGLETKIVNVAKKKVINTPTPSSTSIGSVTETKEVEIARVSVTEPVEVPHSDANTSSMLEDIEMKSSCIAPEAGDTEAAKEKDPSTLLQEPMVKVAIELFDPKKVRIKRNS